MALISNATFSLRTSDIVTATKKIRSNPDFFEKKNLEEAMLDLCRGANYVPAVKAWMQSASLLGKGKHASLTEFALEIMDYDPEFEKANTWWAIHLLLCISDDAAPYAEYFLTLDTGSNSLVAQQKHQEIVTEEVQKRELERGENASSGASVDKSYGGVTASFILEPNRSLSQLGFIDNVYQSGKKSFKRLNAQPSDATIMFALSLAKVKCYPTSVTIDFKQLTDVGLHCFLGCSKSWLASRARALSNNEFWSDYLNYTTALNIDSLEIKRNCLPKIMLKHMLQEDVDGWM
ncbi:DUF4007 family protein [Vibrio splendidus]|uniref:DUF4007 family protein n=1 Tax=Vibrio splendidus TaxID=29497 RepID=UPI000C832736|nr:DUF4007 family protein [Vibrio splendidus]PMK06295.1 hypothetical protein BCU08_17255 [Vibrio splendidus]